MRTLTPKEIEALPSRTPRAGTRRQAELRNRELARLDALGVRGAAAIAVKARVAAIRAFQRGEDPAAAVRAIEDQMTGLLLAGMVAGHLSGRMRTMLAAAAWRRRTIKLAAGNPYSDAVRFLQERNRLGAADLKALENLYGPDAAKVTRGMTAKVERKIKAATADITKRGLHVRAGVAELRQAFEAAGITNQSPWLLETLYRTQTAVAYSAGQWQANSDPAIQEILWGYEYATANDDRVRPGHVLLDGTRLPTNDPRWTTIRPPNGFNCRCFCIEAFNGDSDATPLAPVESVTLDDGTVVVAGPDKGFAFNPGRVFADVLAKRIDPAR
jgi:SPP1 gp7 family putative phage head morphogenesis protein